MIFVLWGDKRTWELRGSFLFGSKKANFRKPVPRERSADDASAPRIVQKEGTTTDARQAVRDTAKVVTGGALKL